MTRTLTADRPEADSVVRDARRAWYRAGVRRSDRDALTAELRSELISATTSRDVLGDDAAAAAREWAAERGVTDRRARLVSPRSAGHAPWTRC